MIPNFDYENRCYITETPIGKLVINIEPHLYHVVDADGEMRINQVLYFGELIQNGMVISGWTYAKFVNTELLNKITEPKNLFLTKEKLYPLNGGLPIN